jgi:hypothetical protein
VLGEPPGTPIQYRCRLSGVVHEQLLAGAVLITEPTVLKALGMSGLVLIPRQGERHALAPQFPMDSGPIRNRSFSSRQRGNRRLEFVLKGGIIQLSRCWPDKACFLEPGQIRRHGGSTDMATASDPPITQVGLKLQSLDFF